MKKKSILFVLAFGMVLFLGGCTGSKFYQGEWNGVTVDGTEVEITFEEKKVIFSADGETKSYDYVQNKLGTKNGISYLG